MAMSDTRKALIIITSILVGIILVVLFGLAILVAAFREREPSIAQNSVLSLRVAGAMPDYVPEDPIRELLRGKEQSLSSFVLQLKKAKVDDRIKAVLIEVNMSGAGLAKAEEIRDAITDFRSSGKPAYAYIEYGMNKEYFIATGCDKIFVAPPGELFINGFAADVMFFRGRSEEHTSELQSPCNLVCR